MGLGNTQLVCAVDDQARNAFFYYYVFALSSPNKMLPNLYEQAAVSDAHLTESIDAVSLAFFAHHYSQPSLAGVAARKYAAAIKDVNRALCDPQAAIEDATLQSVLLLDLYEKISNRDDQIPGSWMAHAKGALAVVNARGERNFKMYNARRLAVRLTTTVCVSCAATLTRVPDDLVRLCQDLDPYFEKSDVKWYLTLHVVSLINFRSDVHNNVFESEAEILEAAWRLEGEFAVKEKELNHMCRPTRLRTVRAKSPLVFGQHYDLYRGHRLTQGWNICRTMRLLLHSIILDHAAKVPTAGNSVLDRSRQIMEETAEDICASVPQSIMVGTKPGNAVPFSPFQVLQSYSLLPPLYVAGWMSANTSLRIWVINTMRYIAEAGAMEVAHKTANSLASSEKFEYYKVFQMFGSYAFAT